MKINTIELYQYQVPLDKSLSVGKQKIDIRQGLILKINALDDTMLPCIEQVEISPLSGQDIEDNPIIGFSKESLEQVINEIEQTLPQLIGLSLGSLLELSQQTQLPSLAFGLSLLNTKFRGQLIGQRISLETMRSIPLIYPEKHESLAMIQERIHSLPLNTHSIKVNVAQTSLEEDIQLIHGILAVRPELKLRLAANRGFELEQAIEFAACLPLHAIEYIEEPCIDPRKNQSFYHAIEMPWALDESLNDPNYQFTMQDGLIALIVNPMLFGNLEKLQALQVQAQHAGVRMIISSSVESSLGIEALARLSQIMTPDELPILDTLSAFNTDILISSGKAKLLDLDSLTLIKRY
ncbi:o-succinylbenzoate synthase [Shewanella sp. VB17]|uniref:o-succinylbenzoate synthase n=1 Tax=Shewanella sp. VB17 TaxID=2739432 RepID=UPI00156624BC|nr:o-succinylbenzoate synthase [Shewanella sp. VB17]NRD75730.1 o-succinylbenzoate synthase [Shewanella sp. VB17]